MRIALDATYSIDTQPSGIGVYSRELLNGLGQQYPSDEYIRCYRWKQWRQLGFRAYPLLPPLPTFRSDVFHALNQRVDRRPSPRVVCTFHDLFVMTAEYSSAAYRERFTQQARAAAARADYIIAVSHFTAGQVNDLLDFPRSRIRVVPHGVRKPTCPRSNPPSPFVLSVGALQVRKNTLSLIKAFEAMPIPWRLVLAGAPSGYRAEKIVEAIKNSPSSARIELRGYLSQEDLDALYASASIFAFPSLDEGFGIPVLEAMANQIPVLTSNTSALKELGEGAALLVDPTDSDAIAQGLVRLSKEEDLRAQLIQAGRARSGEYSWERSVTLTHAVYTEAERS